VFAGAVFEEGEGTGTGGFAGRAGVVAAVDLGFQVFHVVEGVCEADGAGGGGVAELSASFGDDFDPGGQFGQAA
jgi:hypothetical protein